MPFPHSRRLVGRRRRRTNLAPRRELVEIVTPRTNAAVITPAANLLAAISLAEPFSLEIAATSEARRFVARAGTVSMAKLAQTTDPWKRARDRATSTIGERARHLSAALQKPTRRKRVTTGPSNWRFGGPEGNRTPDLFHAKDEIEGCSFSARSAVFDFERDRSRIRGFLVAHGQFSPDLACQASDAAL